MSIVSLQDRRALGERRTVSRSAAITAPARTHPLTRRHIWTALVLYCAAFWGMVGYAIYDIFGR